MNNTAQKNSVYKRFSGRSLFAEKTGLNVIAAGIPEAPNKASFDDYGRRTYQFYVFSFLVAGSGWHESKDSPKQAVKAGDLIQLFPGCWNRYGPPPGGAWKELSISVSGAIIDRFLENGLFSAKDPVFPAAGNSGLPERMKAVIDKAVTDPCDTAGLAELVFGVLMKTISMRGISHETNAPVQMFQCVLDEMRRDLSAPVYNIRPAANLLSVSSGYLRKIFRRHTGKTPSDYFRDMKIEASKSMLITEEKSIGRIAEILGFSDQFHFSRVFKKIIGISPLAYRCEMRNKSGHYPDQQ
ncbi:MAG: hypothetical protein A2096_06800 [Spirochaetes bacterium GWF1_41_5]|nr:MAG: hypothetical protein A2096_06800 [Spirochaetes bacterium GWF1_41_5]HBE02281.1 hypothetical protein [Spirochaetia bacterium]